MATDLKQGTGGTAGRRGYRPGEQRPRAALPWSRKIREEYRIRQAAFAHLLGVGADDLAGWERAGRLPSAISGKARKIEKLLKGLNRLMPKGSIASWLESPNEAAASAGARTPAELMSQGRYDQVEAMIYFGESGVPV